MISFDQSEIRESDERELAGMIVHALLHRAAAQALSFLTFVDRLAPADRSRVLGAPMYPADELRHYLAVTRLRDVVAEAPESAIMLELNHRIEGISRGRERVRASLTSAAYGVLMRNAIGERVARQRYAPIDLLLPREQLG